MIMKRVLGLLRQHWPHTHILLRGDDRYGYLTSAGWKRRHDGKDIPSNWRNPPRPGAKSPEQGRSYNRRTREMGRRREGGGGVRINDETG